MNARLPCIVSRDADRYAEDQGRQSELALKLEAITAQAARELRLVAIQFGFDRAQGTVSKAAKKFAEELMESPEEDDEYEH